MRQTAAVPFNGEGAGLYNPFIMELCPGKAGFTVPVENHAAGLAHRHSHISTYYI